MRAISHLPIPALLIAASLITALGPSSALAEVKTRVGADGIPFIYNEPSESREMRLSGRLQEISRADLQDLIARHADRHRLSRRLVQAVIQVESGYNPRARSHKGAMGLMQLMPATAQELRVSDPYDPEENVRGGTDYLRSMLDRFGDLQLALAAYNAGPTAVQRYRGIPPYKETQRYVQRVLTLLVDQPPKAVRDSSARTVVPSPGLRPPESSTPPRTGPKPKVYVTRGADDTLVMTTTPPPKRRR